MSKKLNDQQLAFVDYYLIHLNATRAALLAGYSPKTARVQGSALLTHLAIKPLIDAGMAERAKKRNIDKDYVLDQAIKIHEKTMTEEPIMETVDGEQVIVGYHKIDTHAAIKSLEIVGKHVNIKAFDNTHKHIGDPDNPIVHENLSEVDRAARIADIFKKAMVEHEQGKAKKK